MSKLEHLRNLVTLEKLIRQKCTGTPDELARRLSVSRGTVYNIIDELNSHGVEIKFCRSSNSFHYNGDTIIDVSFRIRSVDGITEMSQEDMKNTSGGCKIFSSFLLPYNFFDGRILSL
ncbi:MAG: helix-turn-helix domain-containing protein [Bacteroidales bacterium]|nr:helix-turn-helix domain-containing protein [Bacteroidales bacterium]